MPDLHELDFGSAAIERGDHTVDAVARIRHETWTRSDAILSSSGSVPEEFAGRKLALGAYPLANQFRRAVFESAADAVVLFVQPDITTILVRHRRNGFLFCSSDMALRNAQGRGWLASDFEAVKKLIPSGPYSMCYSFEYDGAGAARHLRVDGDHHRRLCFPCGMSRIR